MSGFVSFSLIFFSYYLSTETVSASGVKKNIKRRWLPQRQKSMSFEIFLHFGSRHCFCTQVVRKNISEKLTRPLHFLPHHVASQQPHLIIQARKIRFPRRLENFSLELIVWQKPSCLFSMLVFWWVLLEKCCADQ